MAKEFQKNIGWDHINELEDCDITFLLYAEGKDIQLISKIRNLPVDVVKNHIIEYKSKTNSIKPTKVVRTSEQLFIALLASAKEERIAYLNGCSLEEKNQLVEHLVKNLAAVENAEDKMIGLWIAGEIKDLRLLSIIHREIEHKHGGVRRMVCSALGKIGHPSSIDVLHRSLQDVKPQVRQYAAKALSNLGDERTLRRINNLMNNPKELAYVRRAYSQALEQIEQRTQNRG